MPDATESADVPPLVPESLDPEIAAAGHYDSRGSQNYLEVTNATMPAPGANDSGSQTGVVLEAARALASRQFDAMIVFVAFAGEEQGSFGSLHFAGNIGSYFANASVEAMVACDIVGGDRDSNQGASLQQFRLYSRIPNTAARVTTRSA